MLKEYLKKFTFLKKIVHQIKYSKEKEYKLKSLNLKKEKKTNKVILLFDLINTLFVLNLFANHSLNLTNLLIL